MTVIRIRCERRPGVEAALADTSLRASSVYAPRTLTRPVHAPHRAALAEAASAASGKPSPISLPCGKRAERLLDGLSIIVVEDDDDARELVGIILSNAGASVQCAASAADGFRIIRAAIRPHLLISDIGMPVEDGYSLMRRIRALECSEGGDIPAIALSAFTRSEDRMAALRAGFTLHISKPVHPTALVAAAASLAALAMRP